MELSSPSGRLPLPTGGGRILEMAQSSPDRQTYERKIVDRFGGQKEFEFIVPPQPEMKEAAN
jgi:hypothetical protein